MITLNPKKIFGGLGFFEDDGYEKETSTLSSVTQGVGEVFQDIFSLGQEIAGTNSDSKSAEKEKFSTGSIKFNENQAKAEDQRKEAASKRVFFQALKEDQVKVQQAKNEEQIEQEIFDIGTNLSTEEKNKLLHYQSSYRDRSTYQRAELRRKLIEERKISDKQKKETSVAETKPGVSALNAAMEGGSGSQGAGQANLSSHATG